MKSASEFSGIPFDNSDPKMADQKVGLLEHDLAGNNTRWLEQNREALEVYNQRIAARGVFSDELRVF